MRTTQSIGQGLLLDYRVAEGQRIVNGYMVAIDNSGYVSHAGDSGFKKVVGVADMTSDNRNGEDGDIATRVVTGRVFRFNHDGLTVANIGDVVSATDAETVAASGAVPAGILTGIISETDCWVWIPVGGLVVTAEGEE